MIKIPLQQIKQYRYICYTIIYFDTPRIQKGPPIGKTIDFVFFVAAYNIHMENSRLLSIVSIVLAKSALS